MSDTINQSVITSRRSAASAWTLPRSLYQLQKVTGVTSANPVDHLIFVRVLMANVLVYEDALRGIDPKHPLLPHILDPVEPSTATAAVLPGSALAGGRR